MELRFDYSSFNTIKYIIYILYNMSPLNPYLFSIVASVLTGIHLFLIKYLSTNTIFKSSMFCIIISISFLVWLISRYFVYIASSLLPITIINTILTLSILVSTLLSIIMYQTSINTTLFLCGLFLMIIGVYCIDKSVEYTILS